MRGESWSLSSSVITSSAANTVWRSMVSGCPNIQSLRRRRPRLIEETRDCIPCDLSQLCHCLIHATWQFGLDGRKPVAVHDGVTNLLQRIEDLIGIFRLEPGDCLPYRVARIRPVRRALFAVLAIQCPSTHWAFEDAMTIGGSPSGKRRSLVSWKSARISMN
jgi:hypothetical protein